jgi:hypothetical protein
MRKYYSVCHDRIQNSHCTTSNVTSIHFSESYQLNLIKQIKIKMLNLISIGLTSFFDQRFDTMKDSNTSEDKMNTTLDNLITAYLKGDFMEDIKTWLISYEKFFCKKQRSNANL